MITKEYLIKIGFALKDIDFIMEINQKYSHKIESLVKEYMEGIKEAPLLPYKTGEREASEQRAMRYIESVREKLPEIDQYASRLLAWLNCVPYLNESFKKYGISDDVFFESMKDFLYKLKECKNVYGTVGLFVDWFFLFMDLKLFAFGRLQYEVSSFIHDEYLHDELKLKKGDTVYYCHIPSSGKLTTDMCMDSFQKAYEFFKPQLRGNILPIVSHTWLFYKPYIGRVFPEGSNIERFVKLFDVIKSSSTGCRFNDCWRVFNKMYEGKTIGLPSDNTLRQNFIKYIDEGGDFGGGYGVILYNGKSRKIINNLS